MNNLAFNEKEIEVVVIPLDGIILDLNKYRFNYYKHLCQKNNKNITKNEFYNQLASMHSMYTYLPLATQLDPGPMNVRIEREMKQYIMHSGLKVKSGIFELISYFNQKEIKIAIMTTHRTSDAIDYLKEANLYNKVQFIVGSDTKCIPLPSPQILEVITDFFSVETSKVLVLSSFESLTLAASKLHMKTMYIEDLQEPSPKERKLSLKCFHDSMELLNYLLFDKYKEEEVYSHMLGFNENMNLGQLDEVYQSLLIKYEDDDQILNLVQKTYQYYKQNLIGPIEEEIEEDIEEDTINEIVIEDNMTTREQRFVWDEDETVEEIQKVHPLKKFLQDLQDDKEEEVVEEDNQLIRDLITIEETDDEPEEIQVENEPMITLTHDDDVELHQLLDEINKNGKVSQKSIREPVAEEVHPDMSRFYSTVHFELQDDLDEEEEEQPSPVLQVLSSILMAMCLSAFILFVSLIFYIGFVHLFERDVIVFSQIHFVAQHYVSAIVAMTRSLFDFLHQFISAIPSYSQLIDSQSWMSEQGMEILFVWIYTTVFILIIKGSCVLFKRRYISDDEDN